LRVTPQAARLKAVLACPNLVEYRWRWNFAALASYASAHGGDLPTSWDQSIFTWLTVQRREYRKGKLNAERESILRTLPGVLPKLPALAEAACRYLDLGAVP
jgi:hypothetical protein